MFSFWSVKFPKELREQIAFCKKIIREGDFATLSDILKKEPLLLNRIFELDKNRTLLHWAVYEQQYKIVAFLLDQKRIDPQPQDIYQQTPLYGAIRYSTDEIIELLLEKGVDPNHADRQGFTPLMWAILSAEFKEPGRNKIDEKRAISIMKILMRYGAKAHAVDKNGNTALHHAASEGHAFAISILLEINVLVDAVNEDQETPLHLAAKNGHVEAIQTLLKAGANKQLRNRAQLTPFELAQQAGRDLSVGTALLTQESRFSVAGEYLNDENLKLRKLEIIEDLIFQKKNYLLAQSAYRTELLIIQTWNKIELSNLLKLVPLLVKLGYEKEEFLEVDRDLKDTIHKIVPQVDLIEQVNFYKEIGDLLRQYQHQDPLPYYISALNIMEELEAKNEGLPSNFDKQLQAIREILNELEFLECYHYAESLIRSYCQRLQDRCEDLLAPHHYLHQLKPLLDYLQQKLPNKIEKIYSYLQPVFRGYTLELLYSFEQSKDVSIIKTIEASVEILLQHEQFIFARDIISLVLAVNLLPGKIIIIWRKLELRTYEEPKDEISNVPIPAYALNYRVTLKQARETLKNGLRIKNKSILTLQAEYAKNVTMLLENIARASIAWLGEPPCAYAWIGIGSLSTQALSPYSDLDCALLIANEAYRKHPYFKAFILIINRILKGIGEPWDWSHEVIAGLHVDTGDLPRLLGTEASEVFPCLLNTPEGLAKWVIKNSIEPEGEENRLLAFSLLSPCLLYASSTPSGANLLRCYEQGLARDWQLTEKTQNPLYHQSAVHFWENLLKPLLTRKKLPNIDIKKQHLCAINYLASFVSLYYGFVNKEGRLQNKFPDIVAQLGDQKHWDKDYLSQLFLAWEYVLEWRAAEQFRLYDAATLQKMTQDWKPLFRDAIFPWKILGHSTKILSEMPEKGLFHPIAHSFHYWLKGVSEENANKAEKALAESDTETILTGLAAYLSRKQFSVKSYVNYYAEVPEKYRALFYQILQTSPSLMSEILQAIRTYPDENGHCWAVDEEKQRWEQGLLQLVDPQQSEINFSVEGATIGKQYLKPEVIATLLEKQFLIEESNRLDFNFQKKIDLIAGLKKEILTLDKKSDHNVAQGNHFVFPIRHQEIELHAKVRPDFPGMEIAFSLLIRRIMGEGSPCVALWRFANGEKDYPVLLSQTMTGESLTDELLKQYPLEQKSYSQLVLMSFLVNPGDGNPGNFLAQRVLNAKNETVLRLVSIDNDRLFAPAFEGGHLKIASILYCFKEMILPVHPAIRKRLLKLNVQAVLGAWLEDLEKLNNDNLKLFEKDVALYMNDKIMNKQKSFIFSILKERTLEMVAKKLRMMQYLLQKEPKISHLKLFTTLQPSLARYYSNVLAGKSDLSKKPPETPIEMFEYVVGNEYRREVVAGVRRSSSSVRMEEHLKILGIEVASAEKMIKQWKANFAQAQKELNNLSESFEAIELAAKETLNGSFARFAELSAYAQSQAVAQINLDNDLMIERKPDLIKQTRWWEGLINCHHLRLTRVIINPSVALEDKIFSALWKRLSKNVERFEIVGCQNLSLAISLQTKKLKHLKLKRLNSMKSIYINAPALQYLEITENENLKKIAIKAPVLTKLNAARNPILSEFNIDASLLNEVDFSDCFELSDVQLKKMVKKCENIAIFNLEGCSKDKILHKSVKELAPMLAGVNFSEEQLSYLAALVEDILANKLEELDVFEQFTGDKLFAGLAFKAIYQALLRNQSVTKMNLSVSFISDEETRLLAEVLKKNSNVKQLILFEKNISDEGIVALADALEDNCTMEMLILGPNIGDKGAEALGKMLEKNHSIELCLLIGNSIADWGAEKLADGLRHNRTLQHFGLIANNIGDLGAKYFSKSLEKSTLFSFGLLANGIGNPGAAAFGVALEKNKNIFLFGLASNNIGDKGSALLFEGLQKNNQIMCFGLLGEIGPIAAKKIYETLSAANDCMLTFLSEKEVPKNFEKWDQCPVPALVFDADGTPIYFLFKEPSLVEKEFRFDFEIKKYAIDEIDSENDIKHLRQLFAQGLRHKIFSSEDSIVQFIKKYHQFRLGVVMLISKKIVDKEISLISDGLSKNKSVETFILIASTITKVGAQALARMIARNSCLSELMLLGCNIGDDEAIAFSEALKGLKRETRLEIDFQHNPIKLDGLNALESVAEEIKSISFTLDGIESIQKKSDYIKLTADGGRVSSFMRFLIKNIAFLTRLVPFITSFMSSDFIKFIMWLAKEKFNYSAKNKEHAFLSDRLAFFACHYKDDAALLDYNFLKPIFNDSRALTVDPKVVNSNVSLEKDYQLAWRIQADEYRKALSQKKNVSWSFGYQLQLLSSPEPLHAKLIPTKPDGDCFFHAVKSAGKLSFTRSDLVERLFENANDLNVRRAFSLEIKQFLYLGHTLGHENEAENEACKVLLTSEFIMYFDKLMLAENQLREGVDSARFVLRDVETKGLKPLELIALLREARLEYAEILREFWEDVQKADKALSEYCTRQEVFQIYIATYLQGARGYVAFSRDFTESSKAQTTIDIINQLFDCNIQVYLENPKNRSELILVTQPMPDKPPIPIFHDGVNHFWGLEFKKQSPPLLFSSAAIGEEAIAVMRSKRDEKKEEKFAKIKNQ